MKQFWSRFAAAGAILLLAASPASAGASGCAYFYPGGDAPQITNRNLSAAARELCYSSFVVMHSGIARVPIWSAEHLTRVSLARAKQLERQNKFHDETRLPFNERADLADYARSGMDRGHLSPSADMPSEAAQNDSFSLANMIPQNPNNNRHIWEGIESAVRTLARERGDLYVITGPLFQGGHLQRLNGRVLVPTDIYKIVYDPARREAAAYLVANQATNDYLIVSVSELERIAGIDFFPNMPAGAKQAKLDLPMPTPHGDRHGRTRVDYRQVDALLRGFRSFIRQ